MIGLARQLRILLWKGVLVKRRQKFWLAIELFVPVLLFLILAIIRTHNFTIDSEQCHYDSKALPSAGLLPFLHGFLCSFSNKCQLTPSTDDEHVNINNYANESIVIKAFRVAFDVLREMGADPDATRNAINSLVSWIHVLASSDPGQLTAIPLMQLTTLNDSSELSNIFRDMGLSPTFSDQMSRASVTPYFFLKLAHILATRQQQTESLAIAATMLFSREPLALLCDEKERAKSFLFDSNNTVSSDELCRLTPATVATSRLPFVLTLDRLKTGMTRTVASNLQFLSFLRPGSLISRPVQGLLDIASQAQQARERLLDQVFCGSMADSASALLEQNKPVTKVHTIYDDERDRLVDYIESVQPGASKKKTRTHCGSVPVHHEANCSLLDTAAWRPLRPLLAGYILVSPDSPVTRQLVDRLNQPFRKLSFARNLVYDYLSAVDPLREAMLHSELRNATQNLLAWVRRMEDDIGPSAKQLEEFLSHWLNDSSDPLSFAGMTKTLAQTVANYSSCLLLDRFVVVRNESEMEETGTCLQQFDQYYSGIVLYNITANSTALHPMTTYKIRHLPRYVDSTDSVSDGPRTVRSRDRPLIDLKYLTFGWVFLQELVESSIVRMNSNNEPSAVGIWAQQEPYPCVTSDTFNVTLFLALFVVLSWMTPSALLVKNIVWEKEQRLKELMRAMGLGDAVHWISWATISAVLNLISAIVVAVLLRYGGILTQTSFTLLLTIFVLFSAASICQALLLSTFFGSANIATAATALLYFLFFFPYQLTVRSKSSWFTKISMCLPQTAVGFGLLMISQANDQELATWSNFWNMELPEYNVTLFDVFAGLLADCFAYVLLAWYYSAIRPGTYGVALPWYFPFKKSYWFGARGRAADNSSSPEEVYVLEDGRSEVEADPSGLPVVITNKLSKIYDNGTRALDSLSLRLYEGQITALLGHNGAGKTTTMSLLCGLYPPTSGSATVCGYDVRAQTAAARKHIGICPQHNVLFDNLTVREHLVFFASLKGVESSKMEHEVDEILSSVHLIDKADALGCTLSGGMKRRLCIGQALVGGSRLVILDEPTAGVDVHSRRHIWRLLLANKKGRALLLSTHHMDEADVLADRVVVMSRGRLRAAGSALFLKRRFGDAFALAIQTTGNKEQHKSLIGYLCAQQKQLDCRLVDAHEDDALLEFALGPIDASPELLQRFFADLDQRKDVFGVVDYGFSAPTLEQIFVSLAPPGDFRLSKSSDVSCVQSMGQGLQLMANRILRRKTTQQPGDTVAPSPSGVVVDLVAGPSSSPSSSISARLPYVHKHRPLPTDVDKLEKAAIEEVEEDSDEGRQRFDRYDGIPVSVKTRVATGRAQWNALLTVRKQYAKASAKALLFEVLLPIALLCACELYARAQQWSGAVTLTQNPLVIVPELYGNDTQFYVSLPDRTPNGYSMLLGKTFAQMPGIGTRCVTGSPFNGTEFACEPDWANGTLAASIDSTNIPYNEPIACSCTPSIGWNCSLEDYPLSHLSWWRTNTTDRFWDLTFRNISQFRMVGSSPMRINDSDPTFVGGFSMGHINVKAAGNGAIETAQEGWQTLTQSLGPAASSIGLNLSTVAIAFSNANNTVFQPSNYSTSSLVNDTLAHLDVQENIKVWFNNKAYPSLPIGTNAISNAWLRAGATPAEQNERGILAVSHPINMTVSSNINTSVLPKVVLFRIVLVMLALCLIPAAFSVFLVEERVSRSRHLQKVSGVSSALYWMTNYVFDMAIYVVAILLLLIMYASVGVGEFTETWKTIGSIFLLFLLYGLCDVLLVYVLARFFSVPALAFVLISIGSFFVGVVTTMTVIIMEQLMITDPTLESTWNTCRTVFLILPSYNLGMAVFRNNFVHTLRQQGIKFLRELNRPELIRYLPLPSTLSWPMMGVHLTALVIETIIFALLLVLFESRYCSPALAEKRRTKRQLNTETDSIDAADPAVETEQRRVDDISAHEAANWALVVRHLAKAYNSSGLAVRDLSFAVRKGECFGLLGLNGAGKTTTFDMLTGRASIGHGAVLVQGHSVEESPTAAFARLGYCPQFDALNMKLTTRQVLDFYARVRGIDEEEVAKAVSRTMEQLALGTYADERVSALSGGNRRKLAVAVAIVARPPLILLDEPSAGMDPRSQRHMWEVLSDLRRAGHSLILTSHSMEECEALCGRVALLAKGRLHCIGSKLELKAKFGNGYSLTVKLARAEDADEAIRIAQEEIPMLIVRARHRRTLFLHTKQHDGCIPQLFRLVQLLSSRLSLEDYALSQTTLDEVFQLVAEQLSGVENPGQATSSSLSTCSSTSSRKRPTTSAGAGSLRMLPFRTPSSLRHRRSRRWSHRRRRRSSVAFKSAGRNLLAGWRWLAGRIRWRPTAEDGGRSQVPTTMTTTAAAEKSARKQH